jgi:hypothetical protein
MQSFRIFYSIFFATTLLNCGDPKQVEVSSGRAASDALPNQPTESIFTKDPHTLNNSDLQVLLTTLVNRDEAEKREVALLKPMNKALCERTQQIRTECVASVPLISDDSSKMLSCDGEPLTDNTSIQNFFEVELSGVTGSFTIIADKVFGSQAFSQGTTKIKFKKIEGGGATDKRAPRLMDVSSFRIASAAGAMPAKEDFIFKLYVNENLVLDQDDFLPAEDGNKTYFRLDPKKIFEFKNWANCRMTIDEVTQIKQSILGRLGQVVNAEETLKTGQDKITTNEKQTQNIQ